MNRGERSSAKRRTDGKLIVLEGVDGVGKTTLAKAIEQALKAQQDRAVFREAFPGRHPGTLGHHVHALHHDPARFGIAHMAPASLQLLHIAAHLDAIDSVIRPHLEEGSIVILDRFWWSTWVYGITGGADESTLRAMIELERTEWGDIRPEVTFLVRREPQRGKADEAGIAGRRAEYESLAVQEGKHSRVVTIDNNTTVDNALAAMMHEVRSVVRSLPRV